LISADGHAGIVNSQKYRHEATKTAVVQQSMDGLQTGAVIVQDNDHAFGITLVRWV